jgi:hypothetical protein
MSNLKKIYTYYLYKNNKPCICFKDKVINLQQGSVDPTQTTNNRISRTLNTNGLGGRTVFGIGGIAVVTNSLGRTQGQLGGSSGPLKNKF